MYVRPSAGRARTVLLTTIVAIACAPIQAEAAQDGVPPAVPTAHPYGIHVSEAARRFGIPEGWIWAVMRAESRGDPRAKSPVGAMGVMQIMPATWTTLTARYALGPDPYDVRANIHAGAAYLREMLDRYGDLSTALAAYNAGPGRVDEWRAGARALPTVTIAYVQRIAAEVRAPAAPLVAPPVAWRTAAIFTARMDGASTEASAATGAPPIDIAPASPRSVSAQENQPANALFVPLSGRSAP